MNKNILLLCAHYAEGNNANGICSCNIAEELVKRGNNVWVISSCYEIVSEAIIINDVNVNFIETEDYVNKLKKFRQQKGLLNKIKYFIYRFTRNIRLLFFYPNNAPQRSRQVFDLACSLVEHNKIDIVLGTYRPYESIISSIWLKRKYRDRLNVKTYHLDLLTVNDDRSGIVSKIMGLLGIRALKRECDVVDKILVPENFYDNNNAQIHNKMIPVGFPLYLKKCYYERSSFIFEKQVVNITYVGSLDKNNRWPQLIINILNECSVKFDFKFKIHIWGKLWDHETKELLEKSENVIYHGFLDNCYVQDILLKSDILLNISNRLTYDFLPSKIFQYFALEKPIINFIQNDKDCSLRYFDMYEFCFNIYSYKSISFQIKGLTQFVNLVRNREIDSKCHSINKFEKFTPSYICDIIES